MKILITGITGLIGKKLKIDLEKSGHQIIGVSRTNSDYLWDAINSKEFPVEALKNIDVVIHLAGTPVAEKRWTEKIKSDILKSRVDGTAQLIQAIKKIKESERPQVFLAGSAIGYYGDQAENEINESSKSGSDFLADVVFKWEKELIKAENLGLRTVILRTGIVLAKEGGALAKMPPVVIGDGQNQMSWIHIKDWISIAQAAIKDKKYSGIYNLTAPNPVSQKDFVKALAKAKGFPMTLWAPKIIIQTVLGELSKVILTSQKVIPQKLISEGFQFKFKQIEAALKDIYK